MLFLFLLVVPYKIIRLIYSPTNIQPEKKNKTAVARNYSVNELILLGAAKTMLWVVSLAEVAYHIPLNFY